MHQAPFTISRLLKQPYPKQGAATNNQGGTSIGVALVKELTELMHETIRLHSIPDDCTTFILIIPLQQPAPEQAPQVLVVADKEERRHCLAESLEHLCRVLQAAVISCALMPCLIRQHPAPEGYAVPASTSR